MTELAEKIKATVGSDLHIRWFGPSLVNVGAPGRELTPADVDSVRAALAAEGYGEVESWVATEGMSWLSPGIQTVSIRFAKKEQE